MRTHRTHPTHRDRRTPNRRTTALLLPLLALLALAACGSPAGPDLEQADPAANNHDPTHQSRPDGDPTADGSRDEAALVARAAGPDVAVHQSPEGAVTDTLDAETEFGSPTTFLVADREGDWVQVLLPVRPNGSTGWVHRDAVELRDTALRISIDLEARELTVRDGSETVLSSPVAVGAPDAPTPRGLHYVTDLLATPDPDSGYGPYALGLSAHSETLTEFAGGDGQVGVHGTNDTSSIGDAVSHGCIRLPNDVITELAEIVPLGTPVVVS